MSRIQNGRILQKVDTKENWESENSIILLENEIGFEKETGKYKIGDGTHFWKDLPYAVSSENNDININISNGIGENSIQQTLDSETWSSTNTKMLEHLESVNYTTADGATVQRDESGNFLVGAYGKNSTMMNGKSQTVGGKTHAEGSKTLAFENNAHAEGNGTFAGGKHSHAEGNTTAAIGNSSHAENNLTQANGDWSSASGNLTQANGKGSDAGGNSTVADGEFSFTRNSYNKALARDAVAFGDTTIASHKNAFSTGSQTLASNEGAFTEGHMTMVFSSQGHAENYHTMAGIRGFNIVYYSESITNNFVMIELDSLEGLEVNDTVSIVLSGVFIDIGQITNIDTPSNSIFIGKEVGVLCAEGQSLVTYPSGNFIEDKVVNTLFVRKKPWLGTKTIGHYNHAEGFHTVAVADAQHVQGKYNIIDEDCVYAHIVGNGSGESLRSNAYTLDWEGNAEFAGDVYSKGYKLVCENELNSLIDKPTVDQNYSATSTNAQSGKAVAQAIASFVDSAPETLDTLNELANALGDDPNFAATVATEIGRKVDKVDGKELSTNDFTNDYKNMLDNVLSTTDEEEHAVYGDELISSTGWTLGTGWSGNLTSGFKHTSGTASDLIFTMSESTGTNRYQISFDSTVDASTTNLFVTIGNSNTFNLYGQLKPYTIGITSVSNGNLIFSVSSDFTGTISNISVKRILGISSVNKKLSINDSNGNTSFEMRTTRADLNNLYLGKDSGEYNTTGHGNIGTGVGTLSNNTTGFWNTAIGYRSLRDNTTGSRNVGIGYNSLVYNINGQRNVGIGTFSLCDNQTGNWNVSIGADSMHHNVDGSKNVAIGFANMCNATSGNSNIAIGYNSLQEVSGERNIAMGENAAPKITTGSYNIALGYNALNSCDVKSSNIAIGTQSLYRCGGTENIAIGSMAGQGGSNSNYYRNILIGYNSGETLGQGANRNTFIGDMAGKTTTTGSFNICIGANAVAPNATDSYKLNIGNLIKGDLKDGQKYVDIDGEVRSKGVKLISENELAALVSRIEALESALANIQNAEEVSF